MTTENNAVLRYRDGRTEQCHLASEPSVDDAVVQTEDNGEVAIDDLKAIFFLRESPAGDELAPEANQGSIVAVEFFDGEVIRGLATSFNPGRSGFYLYPLEASRNQKIFVVNSAVVSTDIEKL